MNDAAIADPAIPPAIPHPLEQARLEVEALVGCPILAVGLFGRIDGATFFARVLGGGIGLVLAFLLITVFSLLSSSFGLDARSSGGFVGLMILVSALGIGQMWAAQLLRKAKEIPDRFAVAIAAGGLHVLPFCWIGGRSILLGAPVCFWAKDSVLIHAGNIETRPTGIPANHANVTNNDGVAFLVDGVPLLQALVYSVGVDNGNVALYQRAKDNPALELLKRDYGV